MKLLVLLLDLLRLLAALPFILLCYLADWCDRDIDSTYKDE